CTCERSFSVLRRVHTWLRRTMGQERLHHLAIMAVEKDALCGLDHGEVIDRFAQLGAIISCHLGRGPPPLSDTKRAKGSAIPTTISRHDIESTTLDTPPRPPTDDPQIAIHDDVATTAALDPRAKRERDFREGEQGCFCLVINDTMIQAKLEGTLRLKDKCCGMLDTLQSL
ncbi:unnamed protein product, partial [Pleuronectes platessa]